MATAENKLKDVTVLLFVLVLFSSLGSFQDGYNQWMLHNSLLLKKHFYNATHHKHHKSATSKINVLAAAFPLGGIFGSLFFGFLAERCGRKGTLVLNDLLAMVSAGLLGSSTHVQSLTFNVFSYLIAGICSSIFANAVPIYLGEVSPHNLRGGIVVGSLFFTTIGVVVAQILDRHKIVENKTGLPILLSLTGFVALLQFFLLLCLPESPRYLLIQRGDEEKAEKALMMLRGRHNVEDEMEELYLEDNYENEKKEKKMNVLKLLQQKSLRWQLVCVIILVVGQHLTGIHGAFYYGRIVLISLEVEADAVRYLTIVSRLIAAFSHLVAVYGVDSWGRRSLLLSGFGICSISCILLTVSLELQDTISSMPYISIFFFLIFFIGYIIGPNTIHKLMTIDLFLQSSRSSAYAVAGTLHMVCNLLIGFLFLYIEEYVGHYCFLVFVPFNVASFIYNIKVLPETKRKSFLEIRKLMETHQAKKIQAKEEAQKLRVKKHFSFHRRPTEGGRMLAT